MNIYLETRKDNLNPSYPIDCYYNSMLTYCYANIFKMGSKWYKYVVNGSREFVKRGISLDMLGMLVEDIFEFLESNMDVKDICLDIFGISMVKYKSLLSLYTYEMIKETYVEEKLRINVRLYLNSFINKAEFSRITKRFPIIYRTNSHTILKKYIEEEMNNFRNK